MKKLFYAIFAVAFLWNAVPASVQAEWVKLEGPGLVANDRISDFVTKESTLFAGASRGGIFRSADNGDSWTAANEGFVSQHGIFYFQKFTVSGNNLFAVAGSFVHISTNNGENWVKTSPFVSAGTMAAKGENIFVGKAAGSDGGIFFSTDGGKNWIDTNQPTMQPITRIVFFKDKIILTSYVGIYISTDNGTSWNESNSGLTDSDKRTVYSIVNIDNILFISTKKGVFLSADEGASWNQIGLDETVSVFQMTAYEKNIFAWVVGNWPNTTRGLFVSIDGGLGWRDVGSVEIAKGGVSRMAVSGDYLFLCTGDKDIWRRQLYEMVQTKVEQPEQPDQPENPLEVSAPTAFQLAQNFPNPFNPTTTICYALPRSGQVKLAVYNSLGSEVAVLVNERQNSGEYRFVFNGSSLPSGVYFAILTTNEGVRKVKMMLIK